MLERTTPLPPPGAPSRSNGFDMVRIAAAVLVIYGHSFALLQQSPFGLLGTPAHGLGVKIFFAVSGCLICQSWLAGPALLPYLRRRFFRIIPGLAVCVVLTCLVLGPIVTELPAGVYFSNYKTFKYLKNALLFPTYTLPGVFVGNTYPLAVNGSLWTLRVEGVLYLLTPLLLWGSLRRGRALWLTATAVVICVSLAAAKLKWPAATALVSGEIAARGELAAYFFIGAAFSLFRLRPHGLWPAGAVALAALGAFDWSPAWGEALLLLLLPATVISFGLAHFPWWDKFAGRNDISYGLYLYAFPVQQTLFWALGDGIGPYGNFAAALLVTSALAALSWFLVEKPLLRGGRAPRLRPAPAPAL